MHCGTARHDNNLTVDQKAIMSHVSSLLYTFASTCTVHMPTRTPTYNAVQLVIDLIRKSQRYICTRSIGKPWIEFDIEIWFEIGHGLACPGCPGCPIPQRRKSTSPNSPKSHLHDPLPPSPKMTFVSHPSTPADFTIPGFARSTVRPSAQHQAKQASRQASNTSEEAHPTDEKALQ